VASISKQYFEQLCEKHHFIKKLKRFIEEIYNDSGKKYDFQRYTHQNHWANGINVQGLDQNEDEEPNAFCDLESSQNKSNKNNHDQYQTIIQEINKDDYVIESDSDYFSISDVSVETPKQNEGGQEEGSDEFAPDKAQKSRITHSDQIEKKSAAHLQMPDLQSLRNSSQQSNNSNNNKESEGAWSLHRTSPKPGRALPSNEGDSSEETSREKDVFNKLNPFASIDKINKQDKLRKQQELKEQMILFQLKSNKNWLKISCQLKFK